MPGGIGTGKNVHDFPPKSLTQIHAMQGDPQSGALRGKPRQWVRLWCGQKTPVQGHKIIAGTLEKQQGTQAVHSAAYSNGHAAQCALRHGHLQHLIQELA